MSLLYLLAVLALATGTAAIYMALIERFPVKWLYYHYFVRKPLVWTCFAGVLGWSAWLHTTGGLSLWAWVPLALTGLAVILTYRMHQEVAFPAIDYPAMSTSPELLPLRKDAQVAVIDYAGECRAYPLDYVIHHHIVNDRFAQRLVSLTYCAMCRSIIPFDVTDIGPLTVGSFKHANMIVADQRTKTWFQQATFQSIMGPLHPRTLAMIPFQIMTWAEVLQLNPKPRIAHVTAHDLRNFSLPIPWVWRWIMRSEHTPGLPGSKRDRSFPARTLVIGLWGRPGQVPSTYLKEELLKSRLVHDVAHDVWLVAANQSVFAYNGTLAGRSLSLHFAADGTLTDSETRSRWTLQGMHLSGASSMNLEKSCFSEEYWFSWKWFHPETQVIRLPPTTPVA